MTHERVAAPRAVQSGRTAAWLAKQVEIGLAEVGLSLSQYRVLAILSEGSAISSAMAKRLAVRPPSVSAVVDGLVGRGLVDRRHSDDDRRTVSHELTAEGRRILTAADLSVDARLAEIAAHLSDDDHVARAFEDLRLWQQAMASHREARLATQRAMQ